MKAFVAVATWGSFAEAARRLRISPSAVTRSVAQLEDRLGLTLLSRTTRSVRLTERGQIYLESSRRILEDLETGERQARARTPSQGASCMSPPRSSSVGCTSCRWSGACWPTTRPRRAPEPV
uniref:LysR family transcriptional regulator n=1 Tax=Phenylobacterium glaciei TaxID=2803784 RepID=A0A974P5A5_9CAUL|nr:LysR family transcriptional regulator [Phenylobacterium glaciei]